MGGAGQRRDPGHAGRYPNAVVADWKAASDGHPDFTRSDGIHMSPAGAGVYAAIIAAAL